jgi:thiosulfate dehydrogenase (quinone) large subunit
VAVRGTAPARPWQVRGTSAGRSHANERSSTMITPTLRQSAPRPDAAPTGRFLAARRVKTIALLRIAFGVIWAVDASLKWLPSFAQHTLLDELENASVGQPTPVQAWIGTWMRFVAADPEAFGILLALAETAIAVGLLSGALTNAVCATGGTLSFVIWATGEGFGGPYGDGTTDVGASLMYVLAFALLAAIGAGGVWGVDRWLQPRLGPLSWLSSRPV